MVTNMGLPNMQTESSQKTGEKPEKSPEECILDALGEFSDGIKAGNPVGLFPSMMKHCGHFVKGVTFTERKKVQKRT